MNWLLSALFACATMASPSVQAELPPFGTPPVVDEPEVYPADQVNETVAHAVEVQSAFAELVDRHSAAMYASHLAFADNTIEVDYLEESEGLDKEIRFIWQGGKFRQDYQWIGFTEVFGYDGTDHWYASDMSLPYQLDSGQGVDVTPQLVGYFEYLKPEMRQYIAPLGFELPLVLDGDYALALFSPPQMSQAVLLIDPLSFELAGMLLGNYKEFEQASLLKQTSYRDWRDFGVCRFPGKTVTQTMSITGEVLREKEQLTSGLSIIEPLQPEMFDRASAPQPPAPELPAEAYQIPFSFLDDNVVVRALGPGGEKLRLEIDTGANVGLLRTDVVEQLGLTPVGEEHVTGHGGASIVKYARVEGVVLEGLNGDYSVELPPWPAAMVTGSERFDDSLREKDIAGLLGNFILSNFVVTLDYRKRRMTLYEPGSFDPARHIGPEAYRMEVTRDSLPYVNVVVDDRIRGGAFFNTGAQQYFALSEWAVKAADMEYDILSLGTGMTVNGLTIFGLIEPGQVQMGDLTVFPEERTHLELLAPGESPNPNRIASFGNRFFRHYIVTFDLFGGNYYIEEM